MILTAGGVAEGVAGNVQSLPDNQCLDSTHVQSLERVDDTETVLSSVQSDLVKVLLDQTLLLDELDVGQRIGSKLDSLVETVLTTVRDVDDLDDLGQQTGVEQVGSAQVGLQLGATGQHETSDVDLVVGDKVLNSQLGNFTNVVTTSFLTKTRETQGGLTTTTVLLGQVNSELVDDFTGVTGESTEERSVTVAGVSMDIV